MKKEKVHIISHTHWDAEWYFTAEDTDVLLVNNVRDAVKKLEKSRYPFYWDGQVRPIQKYLEIENNGNLRKQIKEGKFLIGPWYTQSNARYVTGEAYFRNLEYGICIATTLGKSSMNGVMSDIFGFSDQVPQILFKNGVKDIFLMRGHDATLTNGSNEFNWKAPSGDTIFAKSIHMGYGNAKFLDKNINEIKSKISLIAKDDISNTKSKISLLYNGGDQMYFRDNVDKTIQEFNKIQNSNWKMSSLPQYIQDVHKKLKKENIKLPIFQGEIIKPIGQRIHLSAYSQRQDINNLLANLEYKLIYSIEPLNVMSMYNGQKDYANLIYKAWEKLFLCMSHDAAAGCNSDETNSAILQRLQDAHQSIDSLETLIKRNIIGNSNITKGEIVVFNTSTNRRNITTEIDVISRSKEISFSCEEHELNYMLEQEQVRSEGTRIFVDKNGENEVSLGKYFSQKAHIELIDVKPLSFIIIKVLHKNVIKNILARENIFQDVAVENCFIRYEANEGDSYDFSPASDGFFQDFPLDLSNAKVTIGKNVSKATLEFTHEVFEDFIIRKKKVKQQLVLNILIWPSRIEFKLEIDNIIKNARVQLVLKSKHKIETTNARTMFFSKEYKNKKISPIWREKYREKPVNVFPFIGMVSANNINFCSRVLREYQFSDNLLSFTLFRANGMLGKDNLLWRPGRASGINDKQVQTPNAQMQQKIILDFALLKENKYAQFKDYLSTIPSYQKQEMDKSLERLQRFILPPNVYTWNNLDYSPPKKLEVCALYSDGEHLKVRLLNFSDNVIHDEITINNKSERIKLKPWEILTIKF